MHGTVYANYAVSECDLLIALGARFDDRVTGKLDEFASHAQVIHVDIDPAEVGKNRMPQVGIVGDVKRIYTRLISLFKERTKYRYRTNTVMEKQIKSDGETEYPLLVPKNAQNLSPQEVISQISNNANQCVFYNRCWSTSNVGSSVY